MDVKDLVIDVVATLGKNMALCDVITKAVYKDGVKTDEVAYSYDVCLFDKKFKHVEFRIDGPKLMNAPEDGNFINITLINPEISVYMYNGQLKYKATATGIKEIKD